MKAAAIVLGILGLYALVPGRVPIGNVFGAEPSFRFQSSFWVNLHATLREEARRRSLNLPAQINTSGLSVAERSIWNSALDAYQDCGRRSVIFDEELVHLNNWLATIPDEGKLSPIPSNIDANTVRTLNQAAPVYLSYF